MESEVADECIWSASVTCQPQTTSSSMSKRPPSVKQAKKGLGSGRTHEQAIRAQVQASLEMAKAMRMKAQILQATTATTLWH